MTDAIVVLGGRIKSDGTLSRWARFRVDVGIAEYNKEHVPIIMSGMWSFWLDEKGVIPSKTEARAMQEYAIRSGVPESLVFVEERSKDTIGNAYFTKKDILEPRGWKHIIVITSAFHMQRTQYIFNKILGSLYTIKYIPALDGESEDIDKNKKQEERTLAVFKGLVEDIADGDDDAIEKLMYTKHPAYAKNAEVSYDELRVLLGKE